jgi:hypothetical protein
MGYKARVKCGGLNKKAAIGAAFLMIILRDGQAAASARFF